MADYTQGLREASYNEKPFWTSSSERGGGRRVAVFEYPNRDEPSSQDMGAAKKTLRMDIFVIGPNWVADMEALEQEFDKPGPGILVHPTRGQISVVVLPGSRTSERFDELGRATFSVEFLLQSSPINTGAPVLANALNSKATALEEAAAEEFAETFVATGPAALVAKAEAAVGAALDAVGGIAAQLNQLNEVAARIQSIKTQLTTLATAPATLGLQLVSAIHTVTEGAFDPLGAFRTQLAILKAVARPGTPSETAPDLARQIIASENAVSFLVRCSATAEAARLLSGDVQRDAVLDAEVAAITFASREDAEVQYAALFEQLDELLEEAPDTLFAFLRKLRGQLSQHFRDTAPVKRLTTITLTASVPAEVLAHRLYGDATRAEEIVSRNKLTHPLFVPADEPLEVLNG